MSEQMREQFQYWLDHGDYAVSEMTEADREIVIIAAIAFCQASRQAIEVELPMYADQQHEWYNTLIDHCAIQIRAAGIRIKGDL